MFFALSLPLCVYSYQSAETRWTRTLAAVGVSGCVMGLLSTFSRGSWLAVLVAPAILASTGGRRPRIRGWILAALAVVLLDVAAAGAFSTRAINLISDDGVAQRAGLMVAGLLMFQDHPWVGVGPGGFETSLERYGPQVSWLWDYVGTAHNAYIDIAAETGLFGLITFLVFLISIMVGLFRSTRRAQLQVDTNPDEANLQRALLWSFATFCSVAFTAWPFTHGLGELTMLVAALGFSLEPSARRGPMIETRNRPSALDDLIPPEIAGDRLYRWIVRIAATPGVRQMLDIGSSSGAGSTEAFVLGALRNPVRPILHCIELSKVRFAVLIARYHDHEFVRCYNLSSVPLASFPTPGDVDAF